MAYRPSRKTDPDEALDLYQMPELKKDARHIPKIGAPKGHFRSLTPATLLSKTLRLRCHRGVVQPPSQKPAQRGYQARFQLILPGNHDKWHLVAHCRATGVS